MLYPSIQELLKATEKGGEERLNKYSMVMATAKCARVITNQYIEERHNAERKVANKETDKSLAALLKDELSDERAVTSAVRRIYDGEFEISKYSEDDSDAEITIEITEADADDENGDAVDAVDADADTDSADGE